MEPLYREGDFVVISKIPFFFRPVQVGDTIVFRHRVFGVLVKMVAETHHANGEIFVTGIQPESVDSKEFGAVRIREVMGKVVWHIQREKK